MYAFIEKRNKWGLKMKILTELKSHLLILISHICCYGPLLLQLCSWQGGEGNTTLPRSQEQACGFYNLYNF